MKARLEVHQHTIISGAGTGCHIQHSHEGGDVPHQHANTGPATYTIDKDQWRLATGLKGGSRKRFTAKPTGPQLDRVELEEWQKSFRIIEGPRSEAHIGQGGGLATAARMVLGFGMEVSTGILDSCQQCGEERELLAHNPHGFAHPAGQGANAPRFCAECIAAGIEPKEPRS